MYSGFPQCLNVDCAGRGINSLMPLLRNRWAGCERRISNFADDLADGRCYLTLVKVRLETGLFHLGYFGTEAWCSIVDKLNEGSLFY